MTTVIQKQDESMSQTNEERAGLVVHSSKHDETKTSLYIEEYAALLDKYTAACVVRSSAETMAVKAKEEVEEQV